MRIPSLLLSLLLLIGLRVPAEDAPVDLSGYTLDKDVAYGTQSPKQVLDILYPNDPSAAARSMSPARRPRPPQ